MEAVPKASNDNPLLADLARIIDLAGGLCGWSSKDLDEDNLGDAKALLNALGVNQRGWRLWRDYGDALTGPLGRLAVARRPLAALENLAAYLILLQQCKMDVIPPAELVRAWTGLRLGDDECVNNVVFQDVPVGLFRNSWKEYLRRAGTSYDEEKFIADELPSVVEWFFTTNAWLEYDDSRFRHGWAYLKKQNDDWRLRCRYRDKSGDDWPRLLGSWVVRGVLIVELAGVGAVSEEGSAMRHCIADYIDRCLAGTYRVVSLRDPDSNERLATLGLAMSDGEWGLDDLRAQDNLRVNKHLQSVAVEVLKLCRAAQLTEWQAQEGRLVGELHRLIATAGELGWESFVDCAQFALGCEDGGDLGLPRALRIEDLQAAYIAVAERFATEFAREKARALEFSDIDELLIGQCSLKLDSQRAA
jgi:hypothetical protein